MKFNINDKVKIQLTQHGISILKTKNAVSYKYSLDHSSNILDEQLWVIMNTFGDDMHNGSMQLFVNNIVEIQPST